MHKWNTQTIRLLQIAQNITFFLLYFHPKESESWFGIFCAIHAFFSMLAMFLMDAEMMLILMRISSILIVDKFRHSYIQNIKNRYVPCCIQAICTNKQVSHLNAYSLPRCNVRNTFNAIQFH